MMLSQLDQCESQELDQQPTGYLPSDGGGLNAPVVAAEHTPINPQRFLVGGVEITSGPEQSGCQIRNPCFAHTY